MIIKGQKKAKLKHYGSEKISTLRFSHLQKKSYPIVIVSNESEKMLTARQKGKWSY